MMPGLSEPEMEDAVEAARRDLKRSARDPNPEPVHPASAPPDVEEPDLGSSRDRGR